MSDWSRGRHIYVDDSSSRVVYLSGGCGRGRCVQFHVPERQFRESMGTYPEGKKLRAKSLMSVRQR